MSFPDGPGEPGRAKATGLPSQPAPVSMENTMDNKQPEHKNIATALAAAQAEMGRALKQSENPHFRSKYADLGNVMDACLPALNKHGIAVVQPFVSGDFGHQVQTVFLHQSGERIECAVPLILGKNDMQGLGSAVTYARRYGLMCLAGIAPEDDDGNAAVVAAPKGNAASEGIKDAWEHGVRDRLPENASPRQTAEAFADAIRDDLRRKTGEKALSNAWDRHAKWIAALRDKHPDLHDQVVDEYENRRNEIAPADEKTPA